METLQIEIINPKAIKLLSDLAELNLIAIKDVSKSSLSSILKKTGIKPAADETEQLAPPNDTYPFKPQFLKFNATSYVLRDKLNCIVSFEDRYYHIANDQLDITVWGETREEAEDAFAFTFHSLYENFVKEKDENLTSQAMHLKQTLQDLIANIINK